MTDDWVKPYRFGRLIVMFSKAPFYFSGWFPTIRWKSLAWRRHEFKVIWLPRALSAAHGSKK